ncbi:MAG TPA: MBL fold metallo-hydrolase [Actinomycetota bacterium]|nr:MBL fold metallo-hydrolase [Actinomycetota bacterium]
MTGRVERWSERVTRVLAPNPSAMTLEGTNTYVVCEPASGTALVIDPGPPDDGHALRVAGACEGRRIELVLLTHAHADHAEGARELAGRAGAPLAALAPGWSTPGAPALRPDRALAAAGTRLVPVPTPGHSADHCCFVLAAERAMFTGDHVLGRGTTVVDWPEGDMGDYFRSLSVLLDYDLDRLYPGHGPLVPDAGAKVDEYLAHRRMRERQVLGALAAGDRTPSEVVARVYAEVDPALHPAAERSVRAHLAKLVREGRARVEGGAFVVDLQ